MNRRRFCILAGLSMLGGGIGLLYADIFPMQKVRNLLRYSYYHLRPSVFKSSLEFPPDFKNVSLETVLNSRCTSDYDGNSQTFHWGAFDPSKKLSSTHIETLTSLVKIPRFTSYNAEIRSNKNLLTFVVSRNTTGIERDWIMVESGMQQQTVALASAALGMGIKFRNLGKDGAALSGSDYGTIKMKLDPIMPPYSSGFWTNQAPTGVSPRLKGNLPDPLRDGHEPLFSTLSTVKREKHSDSPVTEESLSQLLWAARGRTPHLYNSKPWGMTIPTWAGKQHISSVYLIAQNNLFEYINWDRSRPIHSLLAAKKLESNSSRELLKSYSAHSALIVLAKNEDFNRALWEVGYQFLNLMLQANSLDLAYRAILLDSTQRRALVDLGISDPIAVLAV